jgi:hypothetical protein
LLADWQAGEPQVLEPNKAEMWQWFSLDNLPQPMFYMCQQAFTSYHTGQKYFAVPEK